MERRSFLSLSALSAVPALARADDVDHEAVWWGTIDNEALSFKAVSEDGNLALQVELIRVPEEEMTEVLDEDGNHLHYLYKGKPMPYPFYPGTTLLTRFDLTWNGKAMNIPERSQKASVSRFPVPKRPNRRSHPLPTDHCSLGTSSPIRWIVSKSGTVLRHRHCPPHEC